MTEFIKEHSPDHHQTIKGASWLFLVICLSALDSTVAQNRSIEFENGSWQEMKFKAGKENKLIFLDAYASWCGICKKMSRNVFTNDSVADFFNTNFINAKINMEAGEGPDIASKYNVRVYPSLLFIDSGGNLIHRAEGGLAPSQLIELAKDALHPAILDSARIMTASGEDEVNQTGSHRTQIGFNISQYSRDFGIGIRVISPYFLARTIAIKAGANMQWLEYYNGTEYTTSTYHNFQLGMRGREMSVTRNVGVYGEGGVFVVLPNKIFSSASYVVGGFGSFGFDFRVAPRFSYYIELGGVGTGAKADKIIGQPIYSSGFLINAGFKAGL